jgi:hypothetical protein
MMINLNFLLYSLSLVDVSPNQMHSVTLDPVEKVKLTWMVVKLKSETINK